MNCFSLPPSGPSVFVPTQEETRDSPSVWRCESPSCSLPYRTKSGVPTAPGGRSGVWNFPASPAREGSAPAFSPPSQGTSWSLSSSFRSSEEPPWALVLLSRISVSSGWHSISRQHLLLFGRPSFVGKLPSVCCYV